MTLLATEVLLESNTKNILKKLLTLPSSQYFLRKANILPEELVPLSIASEKFAQEAFVFAKKIMGLTLRL